MLYKLTDEFVWKEIDNKVVTLQFDTGVYWTLNSSASAIWKFLVNGCTIKETVQALTDEFELDEETANQDTADFLKICIEKKMLQAV